MEHRDLTKTLRSHLQTARVDKPTERGHREAEKTSSQEETSILQQLPSTNHKLWAKATQNQGSERSRKWSLCKTQPTSAVSSAGCKTDTRAAIPLTKAVLKKRKKKKKVFLCGSLFFWSVCYLSSTQLKSNLFFCISHPVKADTSRVPWTGRDLQTATWTSQKGLTKAEFKQQFKEHFLVSVGEFVCPVRAMQ